MGKRSKWRTAREILLKLFTGQRELPYMTQLERAGLIKRVRHHDTGAVANRDVLSWEATDAWNGSGMVLNPVQTRLAW